MVLTKPELISSLKNEVRILQHLASKIDRAQLDYRPTHTQRSTLELLQYLSYMGPELISYAKAGKFDTAAWSAAEAAAAKRDFDETLAVIGAQPDVYERLLGDMSDDDFRHEVDMFGRRSTRGTIIVNIGLGGCAAYRTQLFCYLKACGRSELTTYNLWAGMDAPAAV